MRLSGAIVASLLYTPMCVGSVQLQEGIHQFVDDEYFASTSGLHFENGAIAKEYDALVYPEYPWEASVHFYTALLTVPPGTTAGFNQTTWIAYYACASRDAVLFWAEVSVCAAVSTDGQNFTKPLLNYYPWTNNGTQPPVPSNVVFQTDVNEFVGAVWIDDRPGVPASALFKMTYEHEPTRYVYIATSPDGLQWTKGTERAINISGYSDTQTAMIYDSDKDRYTLFGRQDGPTLPNSSVGCPGGYGSERRIMMTATTASLVPPAGNNSASDYNWPDPVEILPLGSGGDPIDCFDSYNPAPVLYNGVYFLLPSAFRHFRINQSAAPIPRAAGNDGVMDIRLGVSRDPLLYPFEYPSRDPFIPRGVGDIDPVFPCGGTWSSSGATYYIDGAAATAGATLCGLFNATGSDRDAGFVFASANGLMDTDPAVMQQQAAAVEASRMRREGRLEDAAAAAAAAAAAPYVDPTLPYVYILYWGSQTTHAGGGAFLGLYWPGAFSGIFRAKVRREGLVVVSTYQTNPGGFGWFGSEPLDLPAQPSASTSAATATATQQLQLRLNAQIATAGVLTVQFQDSATGQPLPGWSHADCVPLRGNGIRQQVAWMQADGSITANLNPLVGYSGGVVLNITMSHAKLASWDLRWRP